MSGKPIIEQTERELIETILRMYSNDEKVARDIAMHISEKIVHRRSLIRKARAGADALFAMWPRIRPCPNCDDLFLPEGKQRYCSQTCRNKANWERFEKRHPKRKRDYKSEYTKRKAKQHRMNTSASSV